MNAKTSFLSRLPRRKSKGSSREFIAKLSKGLMLPIAMLPVAGLFLGIGATIATQGQNAGIEGLVILGDFLKIPGDVIFGALPVLFAIAIAIAFTKDAGAAGLSALVGFLVFSGIQASLIKPSEVGDGYNLLFYTAGSIGYADFGLPSSLFGTVLGITQLQTSVFGGFIVGFTVAFLYNKFKDIQLPPVIGFFSGVRFIPIVTFAALFPITLILLMVWPLIGLFFNIIGGALGSNMVGFNAFIFGYIERSLVPLGLHHAFYSPLWYTSVGGILDLSDMAIVSGLAVEGKTWLQLANELNPGQTIESSYAGDQQIWAFLNSFFVGRNIEIGGVTKTIQFNDFTTTIYTNNFNSLSLAGSIGSAGVNTGQYMQGKYPFMMFGLPAAAAAMVMAAPKENRKMAGSMVISAGATAFLTGITEPIEFTFLFLAPWLFWGFHAFFCALSFGAMTWVGLMFPSIAPHIGMTFSGGALDWVIYGAVQIPGGSNAWVSLLIGLPYVPIYYFFFLWAIKKFDIGTPGRGDNTKLFTKADYRNRDTNLTENRILALNVIEAYGGLSNIQNTDACITKLRIQTAKQDVVDRDRLMALGAAGVIKPSAQSVYSIFGAKADLIKNEIMRIQDEIHEDPELESKLFSELRALSKDLSKPSKEVKETKSSNENLIVYSPIAGNVVSLKDIPDPTFSEMMVGNGVGIETTSERIGAPISGNVELAFPGGHAYVIKSEGGTSIMVHLGIDSLGLKDKAGNPVDLFTQYVDTGYTVQKGDPIADVDIANMKKLAGSNISPVLVLNESIQGREVKILAKKGKINVGDPLFELVPKK
ncbi:MAG: glucose PTS transporter subunit IIA [Metamycoplasmataceae bacterium]